MTQASSARRLLAAAFLFLSSPADAAIELTIVNPRPGEPVFGPVQVAVEVRGTGPRLERIELYLDGLRFGVDEAPPYRATVDVGQENAPHHFEVVAYARGEAVASASLRTVRFQTDEVISVSLRQLYVTAERDGRPALDLVREDFRILDDGEPQPLVTFERGDIPFTAVLLLDASTSMHGERLATALDGARRFSGAMNRLDEAKLVLFSDRILLETPFTSVPAILTVGLSGVKAQGGTALDDALYLALKRLEPRQGRKVVVLLSDGFDIESVVPMAEVKKLAGRQQVAIYWLQTRREGDPKSAGGRIVTAWKSADEHERELRDLREAVAASGGRIQPVDHLEELPAALARLLAELREQYVLGYYPSRGRGPGAWHQVEVTAGPGTAVRTQRGYREE